jgi:ribonuclease HII
MTSVDRLPPAPDVVSGAFMDAACTHGGTEPDAGRSAARAGEEVPPMRVGVDAAGCAQWQPGRGAARAGEEVPPLRVGVDAAGCAQWRPGDLQAGRSAALGPVARPLGYTPRRGAGLWGYERVLARAGFAPVAGIDEAGRGACAGPLVVAAVVLPQSDRDRVAQLADSKALTPQVREQVYDEIVRRALAWHTVVIPPREIDRLGLHVCNVAGMRRALAGISCPPGYVITDGFPVSGLPVPALAMWKADQVAACVAAASVVAKVTRDRIMTGLHDRYPRYDFAEHKGYVTPRHARALADHGPCPEHRFSYVNVLGAMRARGCGARPMPDNGGMAEVARALNGARIAVASPGDGAAAAGGAAEVAGDGAGVAWIEEGSMDYGAS